MSKVNNEQVKYKDAFDTLINTYLENKDPNASIEIEFGVNPECPTITKIEFNQLIMDLYSYGFTIDNKDGEQILYIYPEIDKGDESQVYVKIYGVDYIQQYCKSDSFLTLKRVGNLVKEEETPCPTNGLNIKKKVKSIEPFKSKILNELTDQPKGKCIIPFTDFNFQVLYKQEIQVDINDSSVDTMLNDWKTVKKFFRHSNRVRMQHNNFPLSIDLSIVKTSPFGRTGKPIFTTTLLDSGVFKSIETFNIKIKLNNEKLFREPIEKGNVVMAILRKTIRFILCTLQNTNYPISQVEQNELQHQYLKLVMQKEYRPTFKVNSGSFIGPSTFTLLIDNIMELDEIGEEVSGVPNIRKNYAVTDKADGERKLLFITKQGFIYLIDTNMQISFTGLKTVNKEQFNSILDGEYIKIDKFGKQVSMYFAFDIYFIDEHDVRHFPFYEHNDVSLTKENIKQRYKLLRKFVAELNATPKENSMTCNMKIDVKQFLFSEANNQQSIFDKSKEMLALVNNQDSYQYNRDGIIYTPMDLGVGQNHINDVISNRKVAWSRSLKWKPPQYNTIDFYITIKKGEHKNDLITSEYNESGNIISYKTLVLRCGFNEDTDGYIDPYQDMINGRIVNKSDKGNNYKPYPFIPITPVDLNAQYTNILIDDDSVNPTLKTIDGDSFEENTIVEFKYEMDNPPLWRWVPIRVRYDKTYKLKQGEREYGNSFKTANSIWKSIHFPITEEMISTGGDTIPKILDDQADSYYNRKVKTLDTKPLRDFHNLFVKTGLIISVSNILPYKSSLIDFAVGKAGDLPKWIKGKFGFVFGIDIDQNNIKNRRDGACARYLNNKKEKTPHLPEAFFLVGDVTAPIKGAADSQSWQAFSDDKKIAQVIFGDEKVSLKDSSLGNGVLRLHNKAKGGFQLGSCQFALHYFFETKEKIHGFLGNLTETIVKDGYFIATCYDGKTVFDMLIEKEIEYEETYTIRKDNKKIFEITRMYKETGFPDNELSIGYAIDIFQESINNTIREYLVNANYFIKLMEEYGFILCPIDDLTKMKWITETATGLFSELFKEMSELNKKQPSKVESDYRTAIHLSPEEKIISFLNRYYIFKKVRDVSISEIHKLHLGETKRISQTTTSPLANEKPVLRRIPDVKKFTIDTKKADFI
jgi:mRNA capping enzyme/mRNA capping enzyme, catalytic domain